MMRTDLELLGRRAVAAPGWRWLPGMLAVPATGSEYEGWCRILRASEDGVNSWTDEDGHILDGEQDGDFAAFADLSPDLSDPATVGCLLALVREKWGNPTMIQRRYGGGWILTRPPIVEMEGLAGMLDKIVAQAPTEVEALVLALEGRK